MDSRAQTIRELRNAVDFQRGRCSYLEHHLDVANRKLDEARALLKVQDAVIDLLDRENEEMADKLSSREQGTE